MNRLRRWLSAPSVELLERLNHVDEALYSHTTQLTSIRTRLDNTEANVKCLSDGVKELRAVTWPCNECSGSGWTDGVQCKKCYGSGCYPGGRNE